MAGLATYSLQITVSHRQNEERKMTKQTSIPGDAEPKAAEMTLDDLDAVNGGGKIGDIIDSVVDRVSAVYHFVTGTITSHATTLP